MPLLEALRLALTQIRVQKLKSFFTLLGVTIGVMFLIAVVSIVEGLGTYMEQDVVGKVMAVNTFELRHRPNINIGGVEESEWRAWQRRRRIEESDVPSVAAVLPPGTRHAVVSYDNLTASSEYARPSMILAQNVTPDWFAIKRLGLTSGRPFTQQENDLGQPVVVIGQDVKDRFFPTVDPIGRQLRIATIPYTVIGVAEKQGGALGRSFDKFVVAPYRSPLRRATNRRGVIDALMIQTPTPTAMADVQERVRQVMRSRHKLRPAQPDDFSLQTSESALSFFNKIKGYLVIAGIALPAIGLVVGSIVIMNIMLVAVAERTREIGVRKALGARRRDITAQFVMESAALSTLGAALGIALGIALAKGIAALSPLPATVAPWSIVVAVVLGAGVGMAAGVYPATRAARLDPILALRQE
ncbi:MAG: ABC-type antimicrobial peptide transport system, permease component [uncultured Gemmatimonadaceae bacterium]|uniref:ABC-type antimicrobial peptide transport system, permease component n=1 Tax=uncultured Gemmatimonadaceae bacterium TaxID=246130 RepID=A0A6J4KDX7_9BACT|nr:MAG: ABC-type antimicrobial peptide transport system, permease component [uncultured Gemmatimonadaceae bacterium]